MSAGCGFDEELTAYVDGELPPTRAAEVGRHLEACADCRATEALVRHALARLPELPDFTPSPAARREVLARVDALPRPLAERVRRWFLPGLLVPAGAAALALVLALRVGPPSRARTGAPEVADAQLLELAEHFDAVDDLDVAGLAGPEDLEVVQHLHELHDLEVP